MKIIFIGCVKSSEHFLKMLLRQKRDVVGVITRAESKFNSDFVDLRGLCETNRIEYKCTTNVNDRATKEYIKGKEPDLILCLGWSQLLDEALLSYPSYGSIGFHPAQLPYNKGRHPLIWAMALGLRKTASTFFLMDKGADTGKIVSQEDVRIDYEDDAMSLYNKVMEVAVTQLEEVLCDIEQNKLIAITPSEEGNSWRKRGSADGKIDWRMPSTGIYNLVRALARPYVGAHFEYQDKEYKVWKVREIISEQYDNIEPGKIISVHSKNNFIVKTGNNLIEVMDCDDIDLQAGTYL